MSGYGSPAGGGRPGSPTGSGWQPSTVHKILRRYGCPPLAWTDPATGVRIKWARRQGAPYVHAAPGDLVHVDIKKLGRIPDGGGLAGCSDAEPTASATASRRPVRATGTSTTPSTTAPGSAYSELLADERKETAAEFWNRANAYFESVGITVQRVLTDNGACYRSKPSPPPSATTSHTNGPGPTDHRPTARSRRFNRTTARGMGLRPALQLRDRTRSLFTDWLHTDNHHRGHTALGGQSPADLVPNLRGQNT